MGGAADICPTTGQNDSMIDENEFTAIHVLLEMFVAFKRFDVDNDGSLGLPEFPKVYLDLTAKRPSRRPSASPPAKREGPAIFPLCNKESAQIENWTVLEDGKITTPY